MRLESSRRFQLWEYRVSHGALLIRSPKGPQESNNIDVVFDGVEYIDCPRMLRGLLLTEGSAEDLHVLARAFGEVHPPNRVFVLTTGGIAYHVVASSCRIEENQADIFDSPFT